MPDRRVGTWLLIVAITLERWPRKDKGSPTEAAFFIVRHAPRELRAAVAGAIPLLPTEDFAVAAKLIREAVIRTW